MGTAIFCVEAVSEVAAGAGVAAVDVEACA